MRTTVLMASREEFVVAGAAGASVGVRPGGALEQVLLELRLRLALPVLGEQLHLVGGDEGALHAQQAVAAHAG